MEQVDWNRPGGIGAGFGRGLAPYGASGLKSFCIPFDFVRGIKVLLRIEQVDWNFSHSECGETIYVLLRIEQVDWNVETTAYTKPETVLLRMEQVDWNLYEFRRDTAYFVLLCMEQMDWNEEIRI